MIIKALSIIVLLSLPSFSLISNEYSLSTEDGVVLHINELDPSIQWITIDGVKLSKESSPAGFSILDAQGIVNLSDIRISNFHEFKGTVRKEGDSIVQEADALGLHLDTVYISHRDYIEIKGSVTSTRDQRERAIILAYSLPVDAIDGVWWRDIRYYEVIKEDKVYRGNNFYIPHVGRFFLEYNKYPFSALYKSNHGLAFAVRLDEPTIFRIEYDSRVSRYYITFDFGLSPYTKNSCQANFSFIIYRINEWGFRHAAYRYYNFYPNFFERRADKYGNCAFHVHFMPCWRNEDKMKDFHFAYDLPFPSSFDSIPVEEVVENNEKLGVYTLVYSITGSTYGVRMSREDFEQYFKRGQRRILSREDVYEAERIFKEKLREEEERINNLSKDEQFEARLKSKIISANASRIYNNGCGYYEGDGDAMIIPEDVSYFTGVQTYVNLNPFLPDRNLGHPYTNYAHMLLYEKDGAGLKYKGSRVGLLTFLDKWEENGVTIEGGVIDYLYLIGEWRIRGKDILYNHNKNHFHYTNIPLVFDIRDKKPSIYNLFSLREFVDYTSKELHKRNKILVGSDLSSVDSFLYPCIDILTVESAAVKDIHDALKEEFANSLRIFSYHKPYYIFYNRQGSSYKDMSKEEVEYYIQNCLFYGFYPSFHFSYYGNLTNPKSDSYWTLPEVYERDRDLWSHYMPILIELDKAGWEPITYAESDENSVGVERFGDTYFTVRNFNDSYKYYNLTIYLDKLNWSRDVRVKELVSNKPVRYRFEGDKIVISDGIRGGMTKVYKIYKTKNIRRTSIWRKFMIPFDGEKNSLSEKKLFILRQELKGK